MLCILNWTRFFPCPPFSLLKNIPLGHWLLKVAILISWMEKTILGDYIFSCPSHKLHLQSLWQKSWGWIFPSYWHTILENCCPKMMRLPQYQKLNLKHSIFLLYQYVLRQRLDMRLKESQGRPHKKIFIEKSPFGTKWFSGMIEGRGSLVGFMSPVWIKCLWAKIFES